MMFEEFENLLKQTMGLDPVSVGSSAIARAVGERQLACGLNELSAYRDLLGNSDTELQELVEAIVVPETWFFRDKEAFGELARMAAEWLRGPDAGRALRLLSVPCSTGEEPYSAAMTLIDAGLPADRFHIDAVDISTRALAAARRGIYGKNSFRGTEIRFRDRHFEPVTGGYRIAHPVRQSVHFHQGNLASSDFLSGSPAYDVIFCRNLLIYFTGEVQARALKALARLLAEKGSLFVAPSETGQLLNHSLVSAKVPMAFAFRKAGAGARAVPQADHTPRRSPSYPAVAKLPLTLAAISTPPRASRAEEAPSDLDHAERLANQGKLTEAALTCAAHLRGPNPPAKAYYLMGLVKDACGHLREAGDFYRKALYLDPNHGEALAHLALFLEKQGDVGAARVLRARARRTLVRKREAK